MLTEISTKNFNYSMNILKVQGKLTGLTMINTGTAYTGTVIVDNRSMKLAHRLFENEWITGMVVQKLLLVAMSSTTTHSNGL